MNTNYGACPSCKSEDIYYSKKRRCFICEDCGSAFTVDSPKTASYNLFFSYGHDENRVIVDRLKKDLEALGFSVWIDYERIAQGDDWRSAIVNGISSSDMVLAFLSSHATRTNGVCRDELRIALCERCAYIQPVLLENPNLFTPPQNITERQWIDMSEWRSFDDINAPSFEDWYSEKFQELVNLLHSKSITDLRGDITSLKEIFKPELISPKEAALLKKDFVGRQWLFTFLEREKTSSTRCIHLTGSAGTGKSAISANAQYYLDNVIGTWYCRWDDCKTTDGISFLKTLAFKLAVCMEEYRKYILSSIGEITATLANSSISEMIEKLIVLPMQYTIDGNRDCKFYIVDGLDEADNNGRNEILNILLTIIPALPSWLKFIVTSREESSISNKLNLSDICKVNLDTEPNAKSDFEAYCAQELGLDHERANSYSGNYLLAELCNKSRDSLSGEINSLSSYYFHSFTKQFNDKDFTKNEKTIFALLINAVTPVPVDIIQILYDEDEDEYLKSIKKIKQFTTYSAESFQTFWLKRTISIAHYSLQQWLLSEDAGKYQITKNSAVKIVLDFYERLILNHSFRLTTSIINNYELFLMKNGYYDLLHQKKQDSRYHMIKERLQITDNYSNEYSSVAYLDSEKIQRMNDLSHRISRSSPVIRYHAAEPLIHHAGGVMDDYCEYFIFPCCRHYLASENTPPTVTESGCRIHFGSADDLPPAIHLTFDEQFVFWKNELVIEFRRQSNEYRRIYDRLYRQTIATDPDNWNKLSSEEQEQVLNCIKKTANIVATDAANCRTSILVGHLEELAQKLNLSQNDLEQCVENCKKESGLS